MGNQSDGSGKGASVLQTSYMVVLVSPGFGSQYAIAQRIADLCSRMRSVKVAREHGLHPQYLCETPWLYCRTVNESQAELLIYRQLDCILDRHCVYPVMRDVKFVYSKCRVRCGARSEALGLVHEPSITLVCKESPSLIGRTTRSKLLGRRNVVHQPASRKDLQFKVCLERKIAG
jgi:hypothetical protein